MTGARTPTGLRLFIPCLFYLLEPQHELTQTLPAAGVLELPDGCTATVDHWNLPFSIHQLLEQQQQQQVITLPTFSFIIVQLSMAPISLIMPPILPSDPVSDSVLRRNAQAMDDTKTTEQQARDLEEKINADFTAEWGTASTIAFSTSLCLHFVSFTAIYVLWKKSTLQQIHGRGCDEQLITVRQWMQLHDHLQNQISELPISVDSATQTTA